MKLIVLQGKNGIGKFVQVDDEDFEWLNQWKWYFQTSKYSRTGYAVRRIHDGYKDPTLPKRNWNEKKKTILMHRLILGIIDLNIEGEHIDQNGLNDQRYNLRIAIHKENGRNIRKYTAKTYSSIYKGTCYIKLSNGGKLNKPWLAYINYNQEQILLGYYYTEIESARIYDLYAIIYFEEFASLNFPIENYQNIDLIDEINKIVNESKKIKFMTNRSKKRKYTSKYRGVYYRNDPHRIKQWHASIRVDGKTIHLGDYLTEIVAAKAYNEAAIKYFGDRAILNVIEK